MHGFAIFGSVDLGAIISNYDFNLAYAGQLVADCTDAEMVAVPAAGLVNHPAFTLGHLVSGSAIMARYLGAGLEMPDGWKELFMRRGPGDDRFPAAEPASYPSREALLAELHRQHERVKALLQQAGAAQLNAPFEWRFSDRMPSLLDLAAFLCINHEAMHLGQLAAWRRAMGKGSALARL